MAVSNLGPTAEALALQSAAQSGQPDPGNQYKMPVVFPGQVVWWYSDADIKSTPVPGIVSQVGGRAIHIALIKPFNLGVTPKEGVHHIDDPVHKKARRASGAWDFHQLDKALHLALDSIRAEITALEDLVEQSDLSKKKP